MTETSQKVKLTNIERLIINNIKENKLRIYNLKDFITSLENVAHKEAQRLHLIKKEGITSLGKKLKDISVEIKKGKFWKKLIFIMLFLTVLLAFVDFLSGTTMDFFGKII